MMLVTIMWITLTLLMTIIGTTMTVMMTLEPRIMFGTIWWRELAAWHTLLVRPLSPAAACQDASSLAFVVITVFMGIMTVISGIMTVIRGIINDNCCDFHQLRPAKMLPRLPSSSSLSSWALWLSSWALSMIIIATFTSCSLPRCFLDCLRRHHQRHHGCKCHHGHYPSPSLKWYKFLLTAKSSGW